MPINSPSTNLIKPHFSTQLLKKINLCNPVGEIQGIDLSQRTAESITDCAPRHYLPGSYIFVPQLHKSAAAQLMDRRAPRTARQSSSVCTLLVRPLQPWPHAHDDFVSSPSFDLVSNCTKSEYSWV